MSPPYHASHFPTLAVPFSVIWELPSHYGGAVQNAGSNLVLRWRETCAHGYEWLILVD